jgi:hypothetical protein
LVATHTRPERERESAEKERLWCARHLSLRCQLIMENGPWPVKKNQNTAPW